MVFLYDESGSPVGLKYRTFSYAEGVFDYYYFGKNLQGDVVALCDGDGALIGVPQILLKIYGKNFRIA